MTKDLGKKAGKEKFKSKLSLSKITDCSDQIILPLKKIAYY